MVQPSLFCTDSAHLLSGDEGEVSYYPNVISSEKAAQWFAYFHEHMAWQAERRQMYDREVDVPRLHTHFSLSDNVDPPLREAFGLVSHYLHTPFNSVGMNLYRNQHDSVASHHDKLEFLRAGQPIAILSLGATRRMVIRQKKVSRRHLNFDLEEGSLLVMSWTSQLHYDHGIPKERDTVGPRISLAFRVSGT